MEGLQSIVLVFHLFLAISLVVVILIQRSDGGALGGLGGGAGGGIVSARSAGNILTKTTSILATLFIITSLTLAILASKSNEYKTILDEKEAATAAAVKEGKEAANDLDATEAVGNVQDVPEINLPVVDESEAEAPNIEANTSATGEAEKEVKEVEKIEETKTDTK